MSNEPTTNGYTTVGPGRWSPSPPPADNPGRLRRLVAFWRGRSAGDEPTRPELPRFRSELSRPNPATTETATTPPAGRPTPAKREPGDHTCLISYLVPGTDGRFYILTPGSTDWIEHRKAEWGDCIIGADIQKARKFSCPGAAADWFAARRDAFAGLSGFAIIHAATGEVVTELTEEVVGGTSGNRAEG